MKPKNAARVVASVVLAAGAAVAFTTPAIAASPVDAASPGMLAAMLRDFGLTADAAKARMGAEAVAGQLEQTLRGKLGDAFGGARFDAQSRTLVVGVTHESAAATVRAAGAEPNVVRHSATELDAVKSSLDRVSSVPHGVTTSYVDVASNSVVVTVARGARTAGEQLVRAAGADPSVVRVVESSESPKTLYDVVGGEAYYINGSARCSVGFAVTGGFVTAGHCGTAGSTTTGYNQVSQGTFRGSSFPGHDYSWVQVNSSWTPQPWVDEYNGYAVVVKGSTEAAVGASVCRSGSTTGWHCGTIQAKNQTVYYSQGTVYGLTKTNVCAEPGDSGGSFISGNQAQGTTSGGSGDCTFGGTTYFQPVNPALSAFGLTLRTG